MDMVSLMAALLLVALNAFFVATEFALVRVRPSRIEELLRKQKTGAQIVRQMIIQIDAYLSATQLGITLTSLGLGWIGEEAFSNILTAPITNFFQLDPLWEHRFTMIVAFLIISLLHIVLGELVPKSLAIRQAESVALAVAYPMRIFYVLFMPVIWLLDSISRSILRLIGFQATHDHEHHSEEEIRIILSQARSAGLLSASRGELLKKVFSLPNKTARHLMVPRNEVIFLDINLSLEENILRAKQAGHTRFPLCNRELDEVIGVIDIRDILFHSVQEQTVEDITKFSQSIPYFPELMSAERLLGEFRQRRMLMAIVVDEYGGASGIVTAADVVSAVLGDLTEDNEAEMISLPGGAYDVEGIAPIEEIEETLNITLRSENMRTIAGLLMERLGRMPKIGDRITEGEHIFQVADMQGPRIKRVRIQRRSSNTNPPSSATPNAKKTDSIVVS